MIKIKIQLRDLSPEVLAAIQKNDLPDITTLLNNYWSKSESIPEANLSSDYINKITDELNSLKDTIKKEYRRKDDEIETSDIEDNLIKRIDYLEEKITFLYEQEVNIDDIKAQISDILNQFDLQNSVVEAVKKELLDSIDKQMLSLENQVNALSTNLNAVETKLANDVRLKVDKITLKDIDDNFSVKLESIVSDIELAKENINTLRTSIMGDNAPKTLSGEFDFNVHTDQEYSYFLDEPESFINGPCDKKGFFSCVVNSDQDAIKHIFIDIDGNTYTRVGVQTAVKTMYSWMSSVLDKSAYTDSKTPSVSDVTYSTRQGTLWSTVKAYDSTANTITDAEDNVFTYGTELEVNVYAFSKWVAASNKDDIKALEDAAKSLKDDYDLFKADVEDRLAVIEKQLNIVPETNPDDSTDGA